MDPLLSLVLRNFGKITLINVLFLALFDFLKKTHDCGWTGKSLPLFFSAE